MRKPVIEFKDFSFRYKSQNEFTLHDINLTIYSGEKVLILGPSGSGKSTLGNCINGLIPFSYDGEMQGSCIVSGIETREANIFTISNHVGTVLQDSDAQFVGLSVGEDIAFSLENDAVPRSEMLGKVDAVAQVVGMDGFLDALPYSLSGGQKQKVSLAGIMHNHVETLLFDEPLAALDPAMGMSAIDLIDRIQKLQDKTVLIIEHRLEDVLYRHVDRIILINDGRVQLDTTPDELLRSDVLKQNGIREPLYISALKNAGITFGGDDHLDNIEELDFDRYRDAVTRAFQSVPLSQPKPKGEKIIEVSHVTFGYNRERLALNDVSFDIHRGEKISIIGKNGAGKSTAAKLICGIIRPRKGEVKINGKDYRALSIREIGRMVGYVMQNPNQMLVKDLIRDEVGLAMTLNGFDEAVIKERTERVLRMCGLYSMRNWPVGVLSYGQKKRITIASILVLQPDVIILDEPTAGQDYKRYTEIMSFIDELNRDYNLTIVFITHDMHLAIEYTDRSIVFADGECMDDMRHYVRRAGLPAFAFTPDGTFPIVNGEKGALMWVMEGDCPGCIRSLSGGIQPNVIPPEATAAVDLDDIDLARRSAKSLGIEADFAPSSHGLTVRVKGKAAHASCPEAGRNAVVDLFRLLAVLTGAEAIARIATAFGDPHGAGMGFDISSGDGLSLNPGIVTVADRRICFLIDCRYPYGVDSRRLTQRLSERFPEYTVTLPYDDPPTFTAEDDPYIVAMQSAYRAVTGRACTASVSSGVSYSKVFGHCVTFGAVAEGSEHLAHRKNEKISDADCVAALEIYHRAILNLMEVKP